MISPGLILVWLPGCLLWDGTPFDDNVARLTDADADGYTLAAGDCNDADPDVHPYAVESCDGLDNDCNGAIDEVVPDTVWCQDVDGDSYGDIRHQSRTCFPEAGWVQDCSDCEDSVVTVNPGATESCNGVDDNCDGVTDPPDSAGASWWYPDADGDGYGATDGSTLSCEQPGGTVLDSGDCDDQQDDTYPGASEICNDGRVNDCSGVGDGCGWSGQRALTTAEEGFIAGPDIRNENVGISLGFTDMNADGVGDLVFTSFGGVYGDATAGALYTWYGAPSGLWSTEDAAARMSGATDLYLGFTTSGPPTLAVTDQTTGEAVILISSAGFSSEYDVNGVVLARPSGFYGRSEAGSDMIFGRGASLMEGFGSSLALAGSLSPEPDAILVGAPFNSDNDTYGGAIYLVTPHQPDAASAVALIKGEERMCLGWNLVAGEDFTGDGQADLIAGTSSEVMPTVMLFAGPVTGTIAAGDADATVSDASWRSETVIAVGDANGDAHPDLAMEGEQQVLILDGRLQGVDGAGADLIGTLSVEGQSGNGMPFGLATGDLQRDGVQDLVVGVPYWDAPSKYGGAVDGGGVAVVPLDRVTLGGADLWETASAVFYGPDGRAGVGYPLAVGDANADGFEDLLLSAADWSSNGYPSAGGVWFILGGGI